MQPVSQDEFIRQLASDGEAKDTRNVIKLLCNHENQQTKFMYTIYSCNLTKTLKDAMKNEILSDLVEHLTKAVWTFEQQKKDQLLGIESNYQYPAEFAVHGVQEYESAGVPEIDKWLIPKNAVELVHSVLGDHHKPTEGNKKWNPYHYCAVMNQQTI